MANSLHCGPNDDRLTTARSRPSQVYGVDKAMEVKCHICGKVYPYQLETCSVCGKPTCKHCFACEQDVVSLFDARYIYLHVGPLCPPCESEYKSRISKKYCRVCFEHEVYVVDHEFNDSLCNLSYLLNHYKFEAMKSYGCFSNELKKTSEV